MFKATVEQSPIVDELRYTSSEIAGLSGVSLRQLQWWDEHKVVSPLQEGHRRIYRQQEVVEVSLSAELRRKGFSLQKIRRILKFLKKETGSRLTDALAENMDIHLFGTREKLPGFAHQKLPTKAGGGEPTYGMYHGRTAIKFRLVLTNLKRLRACGADDIDPAVSCPRARPVLQVGHSIRAQVGNFS